MTAPDTITLDHEGQSLRLALKDGKPWFVVADLCRILKVYMQGDKPQPREATFALRPEERALHPMQTSRGLRLTTVVTEVGAYALCKRADAGIALALSDWIVEEALPTIRRTYAAGHVAPTLAAEDLALMREASVLIERLGARLGAGLHAIA